MSTEPCAAITAGEVKFSEAISWIVVFWRSTSRAMTSAISGSDGGQGGKRASFTWRQYYWTRVSPVAARQPADVGWPIRGGWPVVDHADRLRLLRDLEGDPAREALPSAGMAPPRRSGFLTPRLGQRDTAASSRSTKYSGSNARSTSFGAGAALDLDPVELLARVRGRRAAGVHVVLGVQRGEVAARADGHDVTDLPATVRSGRRATVPAPWRPRHRPRPPPRPQPRPRPRIRRTPRQRDRDPELEAQPQRARVLHALRTLPATMLAAPDPAVADTPIVRKEPENYQR